MIYNVPSPQVLVPVTIMKPWKVSMNKNASSIFIIGKTEVAIGTVLMLLSLLSFIGKDHWLDFVVIRLLSSILLISSGSVATAIKSKHAGNHLYKSNLGLPVIAAILSVVSLGVSAADAVLVGSFRYRFQLSVQSLLAVFSGSGAIASLLHASYFCGACCCAKMQQSQQQTIAFNLNNQQPHQFIPTGNGQCVVYAGAPNMCPPQQFINTVCGMPVAYGEHPPPYQIQYQNPGPSTSTVGLPNVAIQASQQKTEVTPGYFTQTHAIPPPEEDLQLGPSTSTVGQPNVPMQASQQKKEVIPENSSQTKEDFQPVQDIN